MLSLMKLFYYYFCPFRNLSLAYISFHGKRGGFSFFSILLFSKMTLLFCCLTKCAQKQDEGEEKKERWYSVMNVHFPLLVFWEPLVMSPFFPPFFFFYLFIKEFLIMIFIVLFQKILLLNSLNILNCIFIRFLVLFYFFVFSLWNKKGIFWQLCVCFRFFNMFPSLHSSDTYCLL